jgi:hypothetical protein
MLKTARPYNSVKLAEYNIFVAEKYRTVITLTLART